MPGGTVLPTFFVVGAAKSGTTSLHAYLGAHPEVEMSVVKEPQVLAGGDWRVRLAEYGALFPAARPVRGESSAVYSQHPRWPGIPERMAEAVPDARIVYLVRDPIDRAVAHYAQHVADGKEKRPIEEAFADWEREDSLFICPSRYATQLRRYLECFDAGRVLVVDQADLLDDRAATVDRVLGFLGVEGGVSAEALAATLNTRETKRAATGLGRMLEGGTLRRAAGRVPLGGRGRELARRLVSRPVGDPELPAELRKRIAGSLEAEVAWLREHTGQAFAGWSI